MFFIFFYFYFFSNLTTNLVEVNYWCQRPVVPCKVLLIIHNNKWFKMYQHIDMQLQPSRESPLNVTADSWLLLPHLATRWRHLNTLQASPRFTGGGRKQSALGNISGKPLRQSVVLHCTVVLLVSRHWETQRLPSGIINQQRLPSNVVVCHINHHQSATALLRGEHATCCVYAWFTHP